MNTFKTNLYSLAVTFVLLLSGVYIHAQKDVMEGEVFSESASYEPAVLGETEDEFFVFASGKDYVVEGWDKRNGKRMYRTVIDEEKRGKYKSEIEQVSFFKQGFVVIYSNFDKKAREKSLYAKFIDSDNGKWDSKEVELYSEQFEKKRDARRSRFDVISSPDNSKMMISYLYYDRDKGSYEMHTMVLGEGFQTLMENGTAMNDLPSTYASYLDNEGSIFNVSVVEGGMRVISYDAYRDYERWDELVEFDFTSTASLVASNLSVRVDTKNQLVITGLVKRLNEEGRRSFYEIEGSMMAVIDNESKETKVAQYTEFTQDQINQFRTKRDVKKGRDADANMNFAFERLFMFEDGSAVTVLEMYTYIVTTDADGNTTSRSWTWGDLMVIRHDADGNMTFANRIPKIQRYWENYGYLITWTSVGPKFIVSNPWKTLRHWSYGCALTEGEIVVFFNDHHKNLEEFDLTKRPRITKKPGRSVAISFSIDPKSGDMERNVNFSLAGNTTVLCPSISFQKTDESDMIMLSAKGKKYSYKVIEW